MNHTELRAALAEDERIQKRPVLTSCAYHCDLSREARTRWPERTLQLREALDEIERLKAAGKVLAEFFERVGDGIGHVGQTDKEYEACEVFESGGEG